ncbi:MFS transporter [Crossiella cryophila]|uniref:MFS family permease n=1 Tax=Crossiella cryophila TaxID=43355 RepID=A0A7W7C470_9PSEU|nr:MFS transporter [Crossiella cryophila]MBB4674174.1 MFS family permease [Crossiella cryophila]
MLAPLRYPAFRLLTVGRVITQVGDSVATIALAFAVLDLTGSVVTLGLVVGLRSIMSVLSLLFGGVIADRLPRHLVLVGSSAVSVLSQAVLAALVITGTATVPVVAVLAAINGTAVAFSWPASSAITPQTAPEESWLQANALMRLGLNGSKIVGASAGGLLVAVVGPGWGLALDALTFAVAGVCFWLIKVPAGVTGGPRTSMIRELVDGWREFVARRWVVVVVVGFMFLNAAVVGVLQVLGPAVADATIGRSAWGLVLAAQTAGMAVGAVIAMRLRVRRLLLVGCACMLLDAVLPLTLAISPQTTTLVLMAFLAGVGLEQFGVAWETSMQQHIPADRLARVYSYDAIGSFLAVPIGEIAIGPAAHAFGVTETLYAAAGVIALATLFMLASRSVRRLENTAPTVSGG